MSKPLDHGHRQTLLFAPLWVYSAVAGAGGQAEPSQFRLFLEELEAANARLVESAEAASAVSLLRSNFDARWASYQAEGEDPKRGLKRTRAVLKRLPDSERDLVARWLVDLAVHIAESMRVFGENPISEPEAGAIKDVASWLDVTPPDLTQTDPGPTTE